MSRNYYYFAATLPMPAFGAKPSISNEEFIEQAEEFLSPRDAAVIAAAHLTPPEADGRGDPSLLQWREFENALRNEMVAFRAKKFGRDPAEFYRGGYLPDSSLSALVAEAAAEDDPLLGERKIDLARWGKLEEMESQHYFDLPFLIVYFLKLQLLNKWNSIREEKGRAALDELLNAVKEPLR